MPATLASLLDEAWSGPPAVPDAGPLLAELRVVLEQAAAQATAGLDPGDNRLPLRLPKDRITRVLACEQLAVATAAPAALSEPVVRGRVLDRLLHHHVHGGGPAPGPALAVAEGAFEAERDDEVLAWLHADPDSRGRLAEDAGVFAERLAALGPIEPGWWPRCEDRIRVELAGGKVVCAAQLDLVAGGSATGRPLVVLEAKSGSLGAEHRDGLFWYALLAGLRHGEPPAAVVGWSGWDGRIWSQRVTADLLRGAAERAAAALDRLGGLLAGRPPTRTACRACGWCPERTTCDEARTPDDGGADDGW